VIAVTARRVVLTCVAWLLVDIPLFLLYRVATTTFDLHWTIRAAGAVGAWLVEIVVISNVWHWSRVDLEVAGGAHG
jgi:hypothetical protein